MKILITAGGTREPLDPVRYIGNRSSGKMGQALARVAIEKYKAEVVFLDASQGSAADLYQQVLTHFDTVDVVIMAAAVADYTPVSIDSQKIKKSCSGLTITLKPTVDILAELGQRKQRQFLVGFCLESENLLEEAQRKLETKNLAMIIANGVESIGSEESQAIMLTKNELI